MPGVSRIKRRGILCWSYAEALAKAGFAYAGFGGRSPPIIHQPRKEIHAGEIVFYTYHPNSNALAWLMFYVYILKCGDNLPYTGCTSNLQERFKRHLNGEVPATKSRLPLEMIFYCAFPNKY